MKELVEIIKKQGAKAEVDPQDGKIEVEGDLDLSGLGFKKIPDIIKSVSGTLDISFNPLVDFVCEIKSVGKLVCRGSKPFFLTGLSNINCGEIKDYEGKEQGTEIDRKPNLIKQTIYIEGYTVKEINSCKLAYLKKKLPELEELFE